MKNKKIILLLLATLILLFNACQKDEEEITLEKRLQSYIDLWESQDFPTMYEMLSEENPYSTEDFIDRFEKIYTDLEVENISLETVSLNRETIDEYYEEKTATIPFTLSMDTFAGPIEFDYEIVLLLEGEDETTEDWFIDWDPGHIFPALKDGGEIRFQYTSPERGEILDKNKMPLAMNDLVFEVGVVPELLESAGEQEKSEIARLLDMSVDAIDQALNANWVQPDMYVPIGKLLQTNTEALQSLKAMESTRFKEVSGRVYPGEKATAHLIGYVGPVTAEDLETLDSDQYSATDVIGKTGLEQIFESKLKGERGVSIYVEKDDEQVVLVEKPVKHGESIQLTIDINVQNELFAAFEDKVGTAAAINPKTGETLALVNSPAYNPNDLLYGNFQRNIQTLESDDDLPLINRFTATYAPGSAIKPVTAAIGLNNQTITPDEAIEINGLTWQKDDSWGDFSIKRVSGTGKPVNLSDALVYSDNIYFAMKAIEMGADQFIDGLKNFGFESDFPFDYPFTNASVSSSGKIDHEFLLANTSYGQGEMEISALHLAMAYTTFLNDGHMLKPILQTDDDYSQIWQEDLISSEQAELIQRSLRDIVIKGTGKSAQRDELSISGKTGAAELKLSADDEDGKENGWFVGYPTDDQDILIAMLIEGVEHDCGSSYVANKVADVIVNLKTEQ